MAGLWQRFRAQDARPSEMGPEPPQAPQPPPLERLVGEVLASVTFVGHYVQFDFNGPRLTSFVWPHADAFGQQMRLGDIGYRDALVALISRTVTGVEDTSQSGVVVRFETGLLVINPEPGDLQGPDIAMLHSNDHDGAWEVWRPGEGSFSLRDC